MTTNSKRLTKHEQVMAIVKYAQKQQFLINPATGYTYALDALRKFYRCPCDVNREHCPCKQAAEEVKTIGHCKCHLFWRDYQAFIDEMLSPPSEVKDGKT